MPNLSTELKVGLFASAALATLGYIFFVLSPESFSRESLVPYYTIIPNASGIVNKTHVKTNGVVIGQVTKVGLDRNASRIDMEINSDIVIPASSRVAIREKGLLGDVFIDIIRGQDDARPLTAGAEIPAAQGVVTLSNLIGIAGDIGKDIKKITSSLSVVLGGKKGEHDVAGIVNDIKQFVSDAKGILQDNRQDVRSIVKNLEATVDTLSTVLSGEQNTRDLKDTMKSVRLAVADIADFSASLKEILRQENRDRIDRIIARFDTAMEDVQDAVKDVRTVTARVERGEGTLGRLISDDETVSEFEGAIRDVREVLAPAIKLETTVDVHSEIRKDNTTQHYFNIRLATRPDKYYLFGLVDVSENTTETLIEDLEVTDPSIDGTNPRKTRERQVEQKALRFNLQFAKRWYFFQLRFGLFETTGGFAADFFLLGDRFRMTFEAFDWRKNSPVRRTAHIRAYLSVLFFKHIYAMMGVDDIQALDPETKDVIRAPNYFFGAGLVFNDKDLKALFGTASLAL